MGKFEGDTGYISAIPDQKKVIDSNHFGALTSEIWLGQSREAVVAAGGVAGCIRGEELSQAPSVVAQKMVVMG